MPHLFGFGNLTLSVQTVIIIIQKDFSVLHIPTTDKIVTSLLLLIGKPSQTLDVAGGQVVAGNVKPKVHVRRVVTSP